MLVCQEELVDYVQTNEGIIGQSAWEDWWRDLQYIWDNRSQYGIFDTVSPVPWLPEQISEARQKAEAGEALPGFDQSLVPEK